MNTQLKSLNVSLEVLNDELVQLQNTLSEKESTLSSVEIDQDDFIENYEASLDDCNGDFMGMTASYILKNVDPIAYRCGLNDYCDNEDVTETEEYKQIEEEIETLESAIEDLEADIEAIEEEIEELEEENEES